MAVVIARATLVNIETGESIARVAIVTGTLEACLIIRTRGIVVACMLPIGTLVRVGTVEPVAIIARYTRTLVTAVCIGTSGILIAVVFKRRSQGNIATFIDIVALGPVAGETKIT